MNKPKVIAVIPNETKENYLSSANKICDIICENGIIPLVDSHLAPHICSARQATENELSKADIIVTLGGDGTLLSAVRRFNGTDAPFLGINYGRLGFLAEIERDNTDEFIKIINGDCTFSEHLTLDTSLDGKVYGSLNDVTVHRDARSGMIDFSVLINDDLLYKVRGDGIIISSPTGSTAYSLSAGGPIVDPTVDVMILTLICPHDLNCRTIIFPKDNIVTIQLADSNAIVSFDGQISATPPCSGRLSVTGGKKVRLIRTGSGSFCDRLKQKLF